MGMKKAVLSQCDVMRVLRSAKKMQIPLVKIDNAGCAFFYLDKDLAPDSKNEITIDDFAEFSEHELI